MSPPSTMKPPYPPQDDSYFSQPNNRSGTVSRNPMLAPQDSSGSMGMNGMQRDTSGYSVNDGGGLHHSPSTWSEQGLATEKSKWEYETEEKRYCWGRLSRRTFILLIICLALSAAIAIAIGASLPFIIHSVAQSALNGAGLTFTTMDITGVVGYAVQTTITGNLTNDAGISGTVQSFPVDLSYNGVIFGSIVMPDLSVPAGVSNFTLSVVLNLVPPATAFVAFTQALISQPTVTLSLNGTASLVASVVIQVQATSLTFNKTISFAGINGGLNNFAINQLTLPGNVPGGLLVSVDAAINNPSIVSLDLGSLNLTIFYEGAYQGNLPLYNFTLGRGLSNITSNGVINPAPADAASTSAFFSKYLAGETVTMAVSADLLYPEQSPGWLRSIVQALQLSSSVTGPDLASSLIEHVALTGSPALSVSLLNGQSPTLSSKINTVINNPFAFSFTAVDFSMSMTLSYGGNQVGLVTVPLTDLAANNGVDIQLPLQDASLDVTSNTALEAFVQDTLLLSNVTAVTSGSASVTVTVGFGTVLLTGIPFSASLVVAGCNNFDSLPIATSSITIESGTATTLTFSVSATIHNTGAVQATFTSMSFDLFAPNNGYLGYCLTTGTSVTLNVGSNEFALSCIFDRGNVDYDNIQATAIMSNYLNPGSPPANITLTGSAPTATTSTVLQTALQNVKLHTTLYGLTNNLVTGVSLNFGSTLSNLADLAISTDITLTNPTAASLTVLSMDLTANWCDATCSGGYTKVGVINQSNINTVVGASVGGTSGTGTLSGINMDFSCCSGQVVDLAFDHYIRGETCNLQTIGTITVEIGGFEVTLNFSESGIPF